MLVYTFLVLAAVICAFRAIRARHLLTAAIWLAGVSALTATIMYRLGAEQVAVVELSVGAGLVTVLFVFAISIAGDEGLSEREFIPNTLAISVAALVVLLLGGMILPLDEPEITTGEGTFSGVLWDDRALDVLVQLVLIFTGVLCLLGLLADAPELPRQPVTEFPRARITSTLNIVDQRAIENPLDERDSGTRNAGKTDSEEQTA